MQPKILFLATEDRFFWGHPLPVARAALRQGYEVVVACGAHSCCQQIVDEGFRLIPLKIARGSNSPLTELRSVLQLRRIYRTEKPDIVHHLSLKPVLYGSIACVGRKNMRAVNAVTGLGYLGAASSRKARVFRSVIWSVLGHLLRRMDQRAVVENQEDGDLLVREMGLPREKVMVTRGAGVDVDCYQPEDAPASGVPIVLLASRMLWIKGIKEFVEAASLLQKRGITARFVLAGDTDSCSPSCVPQQQLLDWQASGAIEWWGHQPNMKDIFRQASLVCLPSHGGEGIPKVLMEAAACGRALVTTNVPGCRDIVRHECNGLVVEPRNVAALADAMERLINDSALRLQMANRGREITVNEFSQKAVVAETLDLYQKLLHSEPPAIMVERTADNL